VADPIDNRVFVLVLQHPQERREALSTAPLIAATLRHAKVAVGLSWPGLARALGQTANDPQRWAVLHLGSVRAEPAAARRELTLLDRHGEALGDPSALLAGLRGIVLLDGTWSQAKTLWWRNPWLLKLHRIVLNPPQPAQLGALRREPRRDALSTVEAAALALRHIEPNLAAADGLTAALEAMLQMASGDGETVDVSSPQGIPPESSPSRPAYRSSRRGWPGHARPRREKRTRV
jgi:tRNA-uridine aminocarboxypropyltransferase